jgi:hypothetical protein
MVRGRSDRRGIPYLATVCMSREELMELVMPELVSGLVSEEQSS